MAIIEAKKHVQCDPSVDACALSQDPADAFPKHTEHTPWWMDPDATDLDDDRIAGLYERSGEYVPPKNGHIK